jgi:hypothetical protein
MFDFPDPLGPSSTKASPPNRRLNVPKVRMVSTCSDLTIKTVASLDVHAWLGWGAPRFPDCGSFRIFTGKDGIRCQGNTGSSHPSFVRKQRGW